MNCTCHNPLGDPCRRHDGVQCAICGREGVLHEESVPCQGMVPDSCRARICQSCQEDGCDGVRYQCHGCELWACELHLSTDGEIRLCDVCLANAEPECTCRFSGDYVDVRGCEAHDDRPLEVMR